MVNTGSLRIKGAGVDTARRCRIGRGVQHVMRRKISRREHIDLPAATFKLLGYRRAFEEKWLSNAMEPED